MTSTVATLDTTIRGTLLLALVSLAGCASGPSTGTADDRAVGPEAGDAAQSPAGMGTLRQDDVTVTVRAGELLIKVTPLHPSIAMVTAPDTEARLTGLARTHGPALESETGTSEPSLFLVSFFSNQPSTSFEPADLQLTSQGLRERPLGIRAITPDWGSQRLGQQQVQMAVYGFASRIDLDVDLVVEYQGIQTDAWRRLLPRIRAEQSRVRARSGTRSSTSAPSRLEPGDGVVPIPHR